VVDTIAPKSNPTIEKQDRAFRQRTLERLHGRRQSLLCASLFERNEVGHTAHLEHITDRPNPLGKTLAHVFGQHVRSRPPRQWTAKQRKRCSVPPRKGRGESRGRRLQLEQRSDLLLQACDSQQSPAVKYEVPGQSAVLAPFKGSIQVVRTMIPQRAPGPRRCSE
jgi:hypothetical protein